ncbi:hypothetical protein [Streptomyces sp. SID13726]|uniref:hypothetical protein n=1 Tax=Streptomyces sp. SID13726 TaxID=2706058 RepID=UPI0013B733F3|nr:hypothetical protein [Streptomyces sp. SID13726]NEB03521.1 hypothetical protein [Streptomyces sp. SID13726]
MGTAAPEQEIAFTLLGALFHRIHLSVVLDRMAPEQLELVRSALVVYKEIRQDIPGSVPFWPLGLPGWADSWVAVW